MKKLIVPALVLSAAFFLTNCGQNPYVGVGSGGANGSSASNSTDGSSGSTTNTPIGSTGGTGTGTGTGSGGTTTGGTNSGGSGTVSNPGNGSGSSGSGNSGSNQGGNDGSGNNGANPCQEQKALELGSIFFDFNSAIIKKDELATLHMALQYLLEHDEVDVKLSGNASAEGTDSYNLVLSRARAESVRKFLVDNGIAEARIQIQANGERDPLPVVGQMSIAAIRAENRRVDISSETK